VSSLPPPILLQVLCFPRARSVRSTLARQGVPTRFRRLQDGGVGFSKSVSLLFPLVIWSDLPMLRPFSAFPRKRMWHEVRHRFRQVSRILFPLLPPFRSRAGPLFGIAHSPFSLSSPWFREAQSSNRGLSIR